MDIEKARELNELNAEFYRRVEASFSATRQRPWKGWGRVRELAACRLPHAPRVLDLACGNLRFERYLTKDGALGPLHAWAVDNCDELAHEQDAPSVTYQHLDVVQALLDGRELQALLDAPPCDLSVSFGFMHHLALPAHRKQVLETLADHTRPGGLVAVSFWQFARDQRLATKATPLADKGDYLLGWQGRDDVRRYCHSFADDEIDELVASVASRAHLVERYRADGKSDDLNCYVVLKVQQPQATAPSKR